MNWMPTKHTLFANRRKDGTWSMRLSPSHYKDPNPFTHASTGKTFDEAVRELERQVIETRTEREQKT